MARCVSHSIFASVETLRDYILDKVRDAVVVTDDDGRILMLNRAAQELGIEVDWLLRQEALVREERGLTEVRTVDGYGTARDLRIESVRHGSERIFVIRDVGLQSKLEELRRLETINLLTASALHDFNNLLTIIIGASSLLQREVGEGTRGASIATELAHAAERAASLSRDLLQRGRKAPRGAEPIDVGAVVRALEPLIARVAGENVALEIDVSTRCRIRADREHLEHVVLNLVANARDAMPRGGTLRIAATCMNVDDDVPHEYVILTVADTGVGMSADVRDRALEPFFTTKAERGTGLGLASAQRFASECGGMIRVRSQLQQGTSVTLYLPTIHDAPRPCTSDERALEDGNETILLVEDEPALRRTMTLVMQSLGYKVLPAASGNEALSILDNATIDLVLSDVVMPGLHGAALAEALERRNQRVLFMSGYDERVVANHALGGRVLRKPLSALDLAHALREALGN